jgi:hypothetical protein
LIEIPMTVTLSGGCQCGAIRYALSAMPEGAHFCFCRMCQKAVGGPFAALAPVRLADFAWTRGTPGQFRSSSVASRHYCAECGTPLSFGYDHKPWIDVTIGSLDKPERVPPTRLYGIESRVPWFDPVALAALPGVESRVTIAGTVVAVESFQHPDHETAGDWTRRQA